MPPTGCRSHQRLASLFQGRPLDTETGLYDFRNRVYHPTLGRWLQRDPVGYVDGMGLYEFVRGAPPGHEDPLGLIMASALNVSSHEGDSTVPLVFDNGICKLKVKLTGCEGGGEVTLFSKEWQYPIWTETVTLNSNWLYHCNHKTGATFSIETDYDGKKPVSFRFTPETKEFSNAMTGQRLFGGGTSAVGLDTQNWVTYATLDFGSGQTGYYHVLPKSLDSGEGPVKTVLTYNAEGSLHVTPQVTFDGKPLFQYMHTAGSERPPAIGSYKGPAAPNPIDAWHKPDPMGQIRTKHRFQWGPEANYWFGDGAKVSSDWSGAWVGTGAILPFSLSGLSAFTGGMWYSETVPK